MKWLALLAVILASAAPSARTVELGPEVEARPRGIRMLDHKWSPVPFLPFAGALKRAAASGLWPRN
jgi:hypothetical protein